MIPPAVSRLTFSVLRFTPHAFCKQRFTLQTRFCQNFQQICWFGTHRRSTFKCGELHLPNQEREKVSLLLPIENQNIQCRHYAKKGKEKGKTKGGTKPKVELTSEELHEVINFDKVKNDLANVIGELRDEYVQQLSLRSSAGSLDQLLVQTADGKFPLVQLAPIVQKNPQLVVINGAAVPQYVAAIKQALTDSGMNLNPQQDGTSLFVPLPKVTREHRESLSKNAKTLCDKAKEKMRNVQNEYVRKVKKSKGAHSEDLLRNLQDTIMSTTNSYIAEAEEMMKTKQKELAG